MQVRFHVLFCMALLCGCLSEAAHAEEPAEVKQQAEAVAALLASGSKVKIGAESGKVFELAISGSFVQPPPHAGQLVHIEKLTHLRYLSLGGGKFGAADWLRRISHLKELELLDIGYVSATDDDSLVHLKPLERLASLTVWETGVHGAGLAHLAELPHLQSLNVGGLQFNDEGMEALGKLKRLKYVNISPSEISDDGLAHLRQLPELENLHLEGRRRITDQGLAHLARLRKLNELYLHNVDITDAGVEHLTRMTQLRVLYLATGSLSKDNYERLQAALPTTHFYSTQWSDARTDPRRH